MKKLPNKLSHLLVVGALAQVCCGALAQAVDALPQAAALGSLPLFHQPEGPSGYTPKQDVTAKHFAVAAANPLATKAGYDVLKAGGSAIDAAIAVQMVLGLVEPQSSGPGGGAFLLHWDAAKRCAEAVSLVLCGLQAYDGRETAPALVSEDLFLKSNGQPMDFMQAVVGGRSVGTPGVMRMLELAHRAHGRLPWAALFQPAIDLATNGFAVSPRMNTMLQAERYLKEDAVAAAYFFDDKGQPWPVGHLLKNPEYAQVLKSLAQGGASALYEGEIAQAIVHKVRSHPTNAGQLSLADLRGYTPKVREPFCSSYVPSRSSEAPPPLGPEPKPAPLALSASASFVPVSSHVSAHVGAASYWLCGMPPPSSGAITIAQILGILRSSPDAGMLLGGGWGMSASAAGQGAWLHRYLEASRLAFADRALYIADPDFVKPPGRDWKSLVDERYLASRAQLIGERAMKEAAAGEPAQAALGAYGAMGNQIEHGTSHISIVDGFGNSVAMTTTIEDAWGARQMVNRGKGLTGGFLLNNQLTDFSFAPVDRAGRPIANRVEAGKRPRSSMSPTMVFDQGGNWVAALGSPGGALIIHFTAKTLLGMLDMGLSPQQAIDLPNFATTGGPALLEEGRFAVATQEELRRRGHTVSTVPLTSGLQAIRADMVQGERRLIGGADPRREGLVMGD